LIEISFGIEWKAEKVEKGSLPAVSIEFTLAFSGAVGESQGGIVVLGIEPVDGDHWRTGDLKSRLSHR
jgi:hypothetical protein